jgi:hypothetical protein
MPPAISEAEFNAEISKRGFRIVRPGDPDFVVWGYVDIGGGVLVDRWRGGGSLASQLSYLIERHESGAAGPPPAATRASKKSEKPPKKGKKSHAKSSVEGHA